MATTAQAALQRYTPLLDTHETQVAIKLVKQQSEASLAQVLNLRRITAPLRQMGAHIDDVRLSFTTP